MDNCQLFWQQTAIKALPVDLKVSHPFSYGRSLLLPMAIISSQPFHAIEPLHTGFSVQKMSWKLLLTYIAVVCMLLHVLQEHIIKTGEKKKKHHQLMANHTPQPNAPRVTAILLCKPGHKLRLRLRKRVTEQITTLGRSLRIRNFNLNSSSFLTRILLDILLVSLFKRFCFWKSSLTKEVLFRLL